MTSLAEMVVASHLSDVQMEMSIECVNSEDTKELRDRANMRLNFVKYLISKLDGNLSVRIDPEEMFEDFKTSHNIK
jgi:hypothetical protein